MLASALVATLLFAPPAEGEDAAVTTSARRNPSRLGRVTSTVSSGSGVALAPGPNGTLFRRSPVALNLDAAFRHPEFEWLELSPALLFELEGRVGVGLAVRARAYVPLKRFDLWAQVGLPGFVAPYTLFGVQGGFGAAYQVLDRLAVTAEPLVSVFFLGNDLSDGKSMAKLDIYGGLRVTY